MGIFSNITDGFKKAGHFIDEDIIHPIENVGSTAVHAIGSAVTSVYNTEKNIAGNYLKASENISRAVVGATSSVADHSKQLVTDGVNVVDGFSSGIKNIGQNLPIYILIAGAGFLLLTRR